MIMAYAVSITFSLLCIIQLSVLKQQCKPLLENCDENSECCKQLCKGFGTSRKVCLGKIPGDACSKNEECSSDMCDKDDKKCTCLEVRKPCEKWNECCDGYCQNKVCVKKQGEDCDDNSECVSRNCDEEEGECTCHQNGQICFEDEECCGGKCENKKCQCIRKGEMCSTKGKYCCDKNEECKAKHGGYTPFCGDCLVDDQQCSKDEECCKHNCKLGRCKCQTLGGTCKIGKDCCEGASCVTENGKQKCRYVKLENGKPCENHGQCISTNCEGNTCKCISSGGNCAGGPDGTGLDWQCCGKQCVHSEAGKSVFTCY